MLVREVLAVCDRIAPPELQESYDNVGLLAGSADSEVTRILTALDLTHEVISEAEKLGAQLIITHHPILFHARKNLREDDPEGALLCRLVRSGRALIAMHTNFDNAEPGVNDALAEALGLVNVTVPARGLRMGDLPAEMTCAELSRYVEEKLCAVVRLCAPKGVSSVRRLMVCGGAGSEFHREAAAFGADAYLTGEIHHHDMLQAMDEGLVLLEAGHYETEQIAIKSLTNALQNELDALEYNIRVFESACKPFAARG